MVGPARSMASYNDDGDDDDVDDDGMMRMVA